MTAKAPYKVRSVTHVSGPDRSAGARLSLPRPRRPRHRLWPYLHLPKENQRLHRPRRDSASASRRSTREFGSSASSTMIWDISIWSREPCNPSTTPLGRGCHPCLKYVLLPICPGRTKDLVGGCSRTSTRDPLIKSAAALPTELYTHRLASESPCGSRRRTM